MNPKRRGRDRWFINHKDYPKYYDETLEYLLKAPYSYTKLLHFLDLKRDKETGKMVTDAKAICTFTKIKINDLHPVLHELRHKNILKYNETENYFHFNPAFVCLRIIKKLRKRHKDAQRK